MYARTQLPTPFRQARFAIPPPGQVPTASVEIWPDPDFFRREILPGLQGRATGRIIDPAGISKAFAFQVRAGKYTPHVSTWEALRALVNRMQQPSV